MWVMLMRLRTTTRAMNTRPFFPLPLAHSIIGIKRPGDEATDDNAVAISQPQANTAQVTNIAHRVLRGLKVLGGNKTDKVDQWVALVAQGGGWGRGICLDRPVQSANNVTLVLLYLTSCLCSTVGPEYCRKSSSGLYVDKPLHTSLYTLLQA